MFTTPARWPLSPLASSANFLRLLRSAVASALFVLTLLLCGNVPDLHAQQEVAQQGSTADADYSLQRQLYTSAHEALRQGDLETYRSLHAQLDGYPLQSYLDYADLSARLDSQPDADVARFLQQQAGTVLATRLQRQWLDTLVKAERWTDVLQHYNPASASTALTCQVLSARLAGGDTAALQEVAALWNVARSQPEICDPLFATWQAAGYLSPELAWQRFSKSMLARQASLARYVSRQMPARERALADTWLAVDEQPALLREQARFSSTEPELQQILHHGLQRLAQDDALVAWELAGSYDRSHGFDPDAALATRRYIAMRLLVQGQIDTAEALLLQDPSLPSEALLEWVLRDALKQQDWQRFDRWVVLLPETALATERWRYWRARSLAQRATPESAAEARALFQALAETRSFYGFLAADLLGSRYELVDRPVVVTEPELLALAGRPAMQRAHELFMLGDEENALREWQHALSGSDEQQMLSAGKLAERWGWHRNGIQALIQVSYWDDLQLRFPLAYQELVASAASQHAALDTTFVYAIARQESAFIHDARSSAGALGLMQLMPATARETASAAGIRLGSNQDILKPEVNITLGSRYLAKMLQDFGGNRILAAAAYNAGPGRVRQWLSQDGNQRLPFDVWIETIPFAETRGYVQNVLAYSVIYGYRMGEALPLLTEQEMASLL